MGLHYLVEGRVDARSAALQDLTMATWKYPRRGALHALLLGLVLLSLLAPLATFAQHQWAESVVVGQVQSVDPSRTELRLTDGTTLLTPPGARLQPEALQVGILVVAVYREQENGNKILTRLSRGFLLP